MNQPQMLESIRTDDLARFFMASDDVDDAVLWQLQALALCRFAIGRPMSDPEYAAILTALLAITQ